MAGLFNTYDTYKRNGGEAGAGGAPGTHPHGRITAQ